ncbi:MAG: Mur ligase domain-containing protein [Candidatus Saccharibacteria bacterium]
MNIYFSGIGGVGIGPLAEIAFDAGYTVNGSDLEETLTTQELRARGINVNIGQDGTFLQAQQDKQTIDWFIYTSALPQDHPELVLARKLGIKTAKRDELLSYIINDKNMKLIAIAGTHGKTTTTGMMIWAFEKLNIPISYSVGTTLSFGPSGKFDSNSQYFIYECDEFDRNFLHFKPYLSLITSVDYDHPDTYPSEQEYLDAFSQFASQSQKLICWSDQHSELFASLPQTTVLETTIINNDLKITGEHNRRNATLVQNALNILGFTENTDDILSQFTGIGRRFEKLAANLYSDYGHHPAEIAATLQLASEISKDIVLVYQPHQNTRQHAIKDQYTNQFELANEIYWLPTYLSAGNREDQSLAILTPSELTHNITNQDHIKEAKLDDELWGNIQTALANNKLVLCMGAGSIDNWLRSKIKN